jgi:hypothetical protein
MNDKTETDKRSTDGLCTHSTERQWIFLFLNFSESASAALLALGGLGLLNFRGRGRRSARSGRSA